MKGSQQKKPRPFVAATQALNTPNLKRNPINRTAYQEKKEQVNDENRVPTQNGVDGNTVSDARSIESTSFSIPNGMKLKSINKPTEQAERFLDETLNDRSQTHAGVSTSESSARPKPQPLVSKLRQYPIHLSKSRTTNSLNLVAKSKVTRGSLVLQEEPHCYTIDTLFNGSHCACCLSTLNHNKLLCQSCGLVYYCSSQCYSADKVMHEESGECSWCAAYRGAASTADHALTRLTLRFLKTQDSIEPLERKLIAKVPRYGQWASQLSATMSTEELGKVEPVIAMWRTRLQALKRQLLLATRACPSVDPTSFAVALHLLAVCGTKVRDLGGRPQALALYGLANLLQHSCEPNVQLVYEGSTLKARALRDVKVGEAFTVAFTDLYAPKRTRQEQLLRNFGLTCSCSRCKTTQSARADEMEVVMAAWKQGGPSAAEEREALWGKWNDKLGKLRQAIAISQAGKPELLVKIKIATAGLANECKALLHPYHQLLHQIQLLQVEVAELTQDWELVMEVGPGLLQRVELTHPSHHPLVAWLAHKLAMALHWLSENSSRPILQRALDYSEEAMSVLQVSCGTEHPTTREVWALGHVLRRKLTRV